MKIANLIIAPGCKEIFTLTTKTPCSCTFNTETLCLVVAIKILFFLLSPYIATVTPLYLCSVVPFGHF